MTWFQLTYASAAATAQRRGGWGIVEVEEGTPGELVEVMEQGVTTQMDVNEDLPEFSTEAMLARRPRSLRYDRDPHRGAAVWWHACQAGHDVTGRPGNIFNHVLGTVDRDTDVRPVSLFRSPSWMTPFGHREVAAAHLDVFAFPPAWETRRGALHRASSDPVRTEALLGAVAHCFHSDRPLILLGEPADVLDVLERASWLTAATVAATIPFSTWERARKTPPPGAPFSIVGMPPEDRNEVMRRMSAGETSALVLDLRFVPDEAADETWTLIGQSWPTDRLWQDAFYSFADLDPDTALRVAGSMDEICQPTQMTELLSPGWPLALALLKHFGATHPDLDALRAAWNRSRPWDDLADRELRALLEPGQGKNLDTPEVPVTRPTLLFEPQADTPVRAARSPRVYAAVEALYAAVEEESGETIARVLRETVLEVLARPGAGRGTAGMTQEEV